LLRHVLSKALERDRNRRYATAKEFSDALDGVQLRLPTQEDETLRVTPLPGTVRTARAAVPTEIVPAPQKPQRKTGLLIAVVLLVVIILGGLMAWQAWRYLSRPAAPATIVTNTIAAPKQQAPSTSTVQVTTETPSAPAPAPVVAPTPVPVPVPVPVPAPVSTTPKKVVEAPRVSTATHAPPVEQAESDESAPIFVEGGSSSRNDAAIASARERLHGITRVSLDARGDSDLIEQLRNALQRLNLNVVDSADVTIRFYGSVTHLRFGRKRRAAEATILRNGRPIFRYEMKGEEYRVGDNPAEAFSRVLSDIFR